MRFADTCTKWRAGCMKDRGGIEFVLYFSISYSSVQTGLLNEEKKC